MAAKAAIPAEDIKKKPDANSGGAPDEILEPDPLASVAKPPVNLVWDNFCQGFVPEGTI